MYKHTKLEVDYMKSREQLQQFYNELVNKINDYCDKMVDAMCDGEDAKERQYNEEISLLEQKKDMLEWVLN